jgi:hypothetical protein
VLLRLSAGIGHFSAASEGALAFTAVASASARLYLVGGVFWGGVCFGATAGFLGSVGP